MATYYRRLYEKHFGSIPVDENGITFEIHHIDGNRKNNDISNLQCISIKEHFEIHYSRGEWLAAKLISERMNISLELKKELCKKISESKKGKAVPHLLESNKRRKGEKNPNKGLHNIGKSGAKHHCSKTVYKLDKNTLEIISVYGSSKEAARLTGLKQANISACCLGKKYFKTAGGYIWKYAEEIIKTKEVSCLI